MSRKNDATPRDTDLDERPFGDSHFGEARRERRDLERPRSSHHGSPATGRSKGKDPKSIQAPALYAWHEGCFEDLAPKQPRPGRSPVRQRPTRTGGAATNG